MANNLVKFIYVPGTVTAEQIAAFDANTLYFIGGSRQIYKGSTLFDGGSANAASDLALLREQIGTLPVSNEYTDLIDYIDKQIAAGDTANSGEVTALDNSLAAVAKSGTAADVAVVDTEGNLDATNVEDALAEIVGDINTAIAGAEITVAKTTGGTNDTFATRYVFSQGGTPITNGIIDITKDMVATNGQLVYQDGQGNAGTFIEMTIANGEAFYIPVADLIEYNSVSSNDEITLTDTNHTISATVGEIAASKIVYRAESGTPGTDGYVAKQTVAQAINALETAASTGVDNKIAAAIGDLDSSIAATSGSVLTGVTITDGELTGKTEVALTAANVAYGNESVADKLDTIGTIPGTSSATTVVGYVDELVGAGVGALDADVDAVLGAGDTDTEAVAVVTGVTEIDGIITGVDSVAADKAGAATRAKAAVIGTANDSASADTIYGAKAYADAAIAGLDADVDAATDATITDTEKVAVVTGITEVDGVITGVDSIDVDLAGAATRAKNAVIGTSGDATTANTVFGAKAYADDAVATAVNALDADLDASGTAQHAGVFVVTGVTQVNGALTAVDSTEVDPAGSAAAAQTAAIAYTDNALTWGSLT